MGFGTYVAVGNLAANQIIVIDANGNVRVLVEGELPKPGEVIVQGNPEFAEDQQLQVNLVGDNGENQDISAEIADIFAALEEGQDPTELGEDFATAAGGQSGSSLTASTTVARDAAETIASTNFDTSGFESLGLSQTQSLALLEQFRLFNPIFVDLNNDPLGDSLAVITDEDTPISGTLTATDQNAQDILTFSQSSAPANGTAIVNPDGTWTYTPNENYNGPDSFTVIVNDGNGGTDTLVVNIDVTPVNDAPVAEPENRSLLEDQVITGSMTATDVDLPDGESLVFTTTSEVEGLTLNPDGSYTFDASSYDRLAEGEELKIEVPVTVTDDLGATDTTTLTIIVTGKNDIPELKVSYKDQGSVEEDQEPSILSTSGTFTVSDVDLLDTHTFKLADSGAVSSNSADYAADMSNAELLALNDAIANGLTFNDSDKSWDFNLDNSLVQFLAEGEKLTITYKVQAVDSSDGRSEAQDVTITVTGTNDLPKLSVSYDANGAVKEDQDSSVLTTSGTFTVADVDASDTHTFKLADSDAVSSNSADYAADLSGAELLALNDAIANGLTFNDSDKSWDFSLDNALVQFLAKDETITITYKVQVVDSANGESTTEDIYITVTGTNDTPIARNDSNAIGENTTLNVTELNGLLKNDSDIDGDKLEVIGIRTGAENATNSESGIVGSELAGSFGTLTVNADGSYKYVADNAESLKVGETVSETFTYTISDGQGGTDTATLTITVTGTNDGPKANDDKYGVETTTLLFSESFEHMANTGKWTVVSGDQLDDWNGTNGLEIQRDGLIAKATDGDYIAELDAHQNTAITTSINTAGQDSVRVEFDYNPRRDGDSSSDMKFTFGAETITVHADGTVSGSDISNVQIVGPDSDGWYKVTAEFDVQGDSTDLTFAGAGKSDSYGALLDNITVTGVNKPNLTTPEDTTIEITFAELLANDTDVDGDVLSIVEGSIVSPTHGQLEVDYENEVIKFKPDANYNGDATFKYQITDRNGGYDDATVTLNVTPVNDAPEFTNEKYPNGGYEFSYDEGIDGTTVIGTVTAEDIDNTQDELSFSFKSGNAQGWFEIDDQGRITLTDAGVDSLANDFDVTANIHNLVVTVSDGTDSVDTTVKLTENNLNDEDTKFDSDKVSFNYQENFKPDVTIGTVTATDKDGDNISYSIALGDNVYIDGKPLYQVDANTGEISLTADGAAAFTNDYEVTGNSHVIKVTATGTDGKGQPTVGTVHVTLNETDDETDNKPLAKDFIISLDAQGNSNVLFDSSDASSDQISDKEDDRDGEPLSVVITERPDSGKLYYVEGDNKTEVVVGQKYANPNNIVYEDDQESTGFFLGLNDTSNLEKGKESTTDFHNWGERVSATEHVLEFADGDKVTITSETRDGAPGKALVQDNADQGHMGFGISVGRDQGIDTDEVIRIDFASRPAASVTLGLSGLGGWFAPNAADNVISRAEITVTFDYGDRTEQEAFFYDDTHNNQTVTIVAPEGAEIVSVEASTKGPGNWELTSLEAKASDSFDYKAVDSDGNESDVKTVTIAEGNTAPFANDDPDGYSINLGSLNNDDWSGYESVVSAHYQGSDKAVNISMDGDLKMGVDSDANGGPGAQIQYNRETGVSEQLVFDLAKPSTEFSFTVSNLIKNEGGRGNHEQGKWVAYFGDTAVASGMFTANEAGNTGSYSFDTNGEFAFDRVVFEAVDFVEVPARGTDSSDYFVTGFSASSDGGVHVIEQDPDGTTEFRIPVSELLSNDGDVDGDEIRITYVFGEQNGDAYIDGDEVVFNLDRDHVGPAEFKYQITDDKGGFAEATVKVIVNPVEPNDVTVKSIEGTDAQEGDNLVYKVILSEGPLSAQSFKLTYGGANDSADKQADVDLTKVVFTNGVKFENGQITVPVGVSSFSILVPALKDGTYENPETFSVTLGEGSDAVSDSATISNIDELELTVQSTSDVAEGSKAVFSVSLSNPSSENIDVSLAISLDGDATSAEQADFKDISELFTAYYLEPQLPGEPLRVELEIVIKDGKPTVTIPNGETEIFVEVATKDDSVFEGAEDFTLVVTDESGYVSNDSASDEATILDDGTDPDGPQGPQVGNDDRPVVERISDIEIEEGKSGTFVVELSNSSELKTTIEMSLNDGSAVSVDGQPTEGDFNASSVIVTFGEGANKQSETVEVINGKFVVSVPEGHESFTVQVATNQDAHSDNNEKFSISGNATHQQDAVTGVATIVDNEAPMVDLNGVLYDIEYVSEGAGYSNVFGYYIYDEESDTQQLHVLISNNNDQSLKPGTLLDSPLSSIDNLELFLIPNGFSKIASEDLNKLELNDQGQLVVDGEVKSRIPVYKSTDEDHQISTTVDADGNLVLSFDDQKGQGNDDNDFNDIVIKVSKVDTDGINFDSSYVEGGEAAIADIDADVFDDKDVIQSMNVTLTNAKDGDNLTWAENSGFNVVKTVTGTSIALVITHPSGSVSANEFEAFLKSIRFVNSSDTPDEETRLVDVTVSDGVNQSETATASISVTDTDELSFNNVAGLEDRFIDLNISVADAATSVSTIELSGIPQGATVVVDGVESTVGNSGLIVVGIDDIDSVKVKAPEHSDVNFEITVTAKDGNNVVETGSIYVDVHPDADKPILKIGDFEKVAAIDFEDVVLNNSGHPSWDSGIAINDVAGAGTIGEWKTSNAGQHVEVGTEGTYLSGSSTNQVMEIEGEVGDKVLYTDMDLVAGRFYNFQFDIAARNDVDPSDSDMEVSLYKLDDFGNPIADSKVTLYDFIAERVGDGWQKGTFTLPVEDSGKYRLVLEADEADSTGAIIDNIQFTAVDNYGYEDSFIKLSEISASLVDVEDRSETLTIELQGLPVGAVLIDGTGPNANKYIVTETNKNDKIDVTDWNLAQLQVKVLDPSTFDIKVIATATESDTNKDDDVHVDHGDLGGKLTNASEATINVTVLERPQGPVDTNERPIANDFTVTSDTNVANVNFAPHATDSEDDASTSDNKHTSVRIEELPEHGKLYEVNDKGEIVGDALTVGKVVLDSAKIIYVADANNIVSTDLALSSLTPTEQTALAHTGNGVSELDRNGITISGGTFDEVNKVFETDSNATIKYDDTNGQEGLFVSSKHDSGKGLETGRGEYVSISSNEGDISSATLSFASLQGQFNGNNPHATLVAYLFHNGQFVAEVGPLKILESSKHAGYATIKPDEGIFDEIRLVVNNSTPSKGAGFNLADVELDVTGVEDINDEFKYSAIDSDDQSSISEPLVNGSIGTVQVSASKIIGSDSGGIDNVNASGSVLTWPSSAAVIAEGESHTSHHYDNVNGIAIDVGIGGDVVQLGSGSDTIYLGDSASQVYPKDDAFDNVLSTFARENIGSLNDANGSEDSGLLVTKESKEGLDIAQGGGGNDHIYGEGGSDIIFGGTGHDYLDGGIGNDAVRGGSGDDIIIGGEGNDFLTGDSGEDIFQFIDQGAGIRDGEVDRITDFTKGVDKIDISDLLHTDENDTIDSLFANKEVGLAVNGSDLTLTLSERGDDVGERSQKVVIEGGANEYRDYISGSSITDTSAILNDLLKVYDTTNH
ncbi:tandem-95 repeat protein [Vibrio sp. Hep-1b-8]|uniref:tandem-95 repeat protein n=1 Tax=Vibrio sp. Hep-1b-8 TaxID=2144187 RepID=UPI0011105026|nr:tandem-95 repeat protein [Vibrio sp. Hep-1b-8]TMX36802.1 hypothetical protein DA100_12055 [Vibrio sp. Hep-1b-8]